MTELTIIDDHDTTRASFDIRDSGPAERMVRILMTFDPARFDLSHTTPPIAGLNSPAGVCVFATIEDVKALRAYLDTVIPTLEAQRAADEARP